jgi:cysteine desulfurase/selenocysteine lyase
MKNIRTHEKKLTALHYKNFRRSPASSYMAQKRSKRTESFPTSKNIHPHDLASLLDEQDIAIRAGNHCAMPLHTLLGIPATARMSFSLYTTPADIRTACRALKTIVKKLQ